MKHRTDSAFTLVEIMVVVSIMAIVVSIAVPTWLRQREISRARSCQENLCKIDSAKEQYALEFRATNDSEVTLVQLVVPPGTAEGERSGYLRALPACPSGGTYAPNTIGNDPTCSIPEGSIPGTGHTIP